MSIHMSCASCLATEGTTPLAYAVSQVGNKDVFDIQAFQAGWLYGIEGDAEVANRLDTPQANPLTTQSWMLGFIAGRYADQWGAVTPQCFRPDEHTAFSATL
jgi:hypothetical protein